MDIRRYSKLIKILSIFIALTVFSAIWTFPRIRNSSDPKSEARFHQHQGDGFTELGVLTAHQYWKKFGYSSTKFLPCIEESSLATGVCKPYTHYPPGIYLLSSTVLHFFEALFTEESALIGARFFYYFLTLLLCSAGLFFIAQSLEFNFFSILVATATLGISRGFWLFADNLFGNGLVLGLFGLLLSLVISKKKYFKIYFFLACITTIFTVELIPALFLFPLLHFVVFLNESSFYKNLIGAWCIAASAVLLVLGARITQNAWYLGSFSPAIQDWIEIVRFRILGTTDGSLHPAGHVAVTANNIFFQQYIHAWFDNQRAILTKLGIFIIWFSFLLLAALKKRKEFLILLISYFLCIQWSFFFIQHSMIHLFTFRYAVWALSLAVALLSQLFFKRKQWQ